MATRRITLLDPAFSTPFASNGRKTLQITLHKGKGESMGHGIIAWIIIGVIAGWLTGKIMKGSGFGFFVDMLVGLVGAMIGGFLSSHIGLGGVGDDGLRISIVIATVGAVILTFLLRLVTGNRD